jgi:hypothetical protein
MEYLLGSVVTLLCVIVLNLFIRAEAKKPMPRLQNTQSYLYKLMADLTFREAEKSQKLRQSDKYLQKDTVKVMIVEDKAYWIKDNQLFVADFVDGEVDKYSTRQVDTMGMNNVELERTMFVVEKLTEEN